MCRPVLRLAIAFERSELGNNYCERDTWAMVKVLERLRELAVSTL